MHDQYDCCTSMLEPEGFIYLCRLSFTLCLGVWVSDIYLSMVCQLSRDRRGYKSLFYILDLAMRF